MRLLRPQVLPHAFLVLLASAAAAQSPAPAAARDGEQCAPGRWYTTGGDASHNAWSANPPMRHRPNLAWRQAIDGEIVGEPLVWDDHVVLGLRTSPKRCAIEVRRLSDGSLIGQRALDSTADPNPALWGTEVVWCGGTGGYELVRIGPKGVKAVSRMLNAKQVGQPVRLGTKVYGVVDGHIACLRATDFRVEWRTTAIGFVGPLAIGDQILHALRRADGNNYEVLAIDRQSGEVRGASARLALTHAPDPDAFLQTAGNELLVRFGTGHFLADYKADKIDINAVTLQVPITAHPEMQPAALPLPRALDNQRQVGAVATELSMQLGMFDAGKQDGIRLDSCPLHRDLAKVPPTLCGDVMYFGACAVETKGLRMLWRLDQVGGKLLPRTRAIPAGDTLLLAGDHELVALRASMPANPIVTQLDTDWHAAQSRRLTTLVERALAAGDADLAMDLLSRCRELSVDEDWATKQEKSIAARAKSKLRPDPAKATAVRNEADAVERDALDEMHNSLAGWSARPVADRLQALRFVLEHSPTHAGAVADVRRLLPPDVTPSEPFAALDWLDFVGAITRTKVTFFEAKLADFGDDQKLDPIVAQDKQQLLEWRSRWRQDLKAVLSERMLLFSPITQPGSLAKALATGELVCDTLEAMFAGMPAVRKEPRPMLVFLYANRDEYLAESKKLGVDSAVWAAGYYSDHLNELVAKSRLYVPNDEAAFNEVLPTLAHELTHQWLMDRCPAFTPDAMAARAGPKAFWIVEGFASMIEQFDFDIVHHEAHLGLDNLERADLVASATPLQLLGWKSLTDCSWEGYSRVTVDPAELDVLSRMRLGARFKTTRLGLFYAQSAMLTRYLYEAEDGKYRAKLLEFVAAYYTGQMAKLDFEPAFGVSAEELGPKVVAFAKSLLQ